MQRGNKKLSKSKINYFYIYQKLPNLNEFRAEIARNKYKGGQMKSDVEDSIITAIMYAKSKNTLHPIQTYPIQINCVWGMKNYNKMDRDNRRASVKFILDGMQKAGIIPNDSPKYVSDLFDEYKRAEQDFVKVEIIEYPLHIKLVLEENAENG